MKAVLWTIVLIAVVGMTTKGVGAYEATFSGTTSAPLVLVSDYTLPYPGILPDHPLYVLKVARDRVIGFLIADPLKKAEFYLLQADKRLQAGLFLMNKKADPILIGSTISKGENYFSQALTSIKELGRKESTQRLLQEMVKAAKKHQEVLLAMEKRAEKNLALQLKKERERMASYEKEVALLIAERKN